MVCWTGLPSSSFSNLILVASSWPWRKKAFAPWKSTKATHIGHLCNPTGIWLVNTRRHTPAQNSWQLGNGALAGEGQPEWYRLYLLHRGYRRPTPKLSIQYSSAGNCLLYSWLFLASFKLYGFEMHRNNKWQYSSQNNYGFEHRRTVEHRWGTCLWME